MSSWPLKGRAHGMCISDVHLFLRCHVTSGIGHLRPTVPRGWQQVDVLTVALSKAIKGKENVLMDHTSLAALFGNF